MAEDLKGKLSIFGKKAAERASLVRGQTTKKAHHFLDRFLSFALSPWRAFKLLCFFIGFAVLILATGVSLYSYHFFDSLPQMDEMSFKELKSIANQRVNKRLEDKSKRYKWVSIKNVNRQFLFSLVLSEDATFFEHNGFNYEAMVDSLAENIKARKAAFGGSTISQQVIKNLFLSNEKTLQRKLREAILTWNLERRFSKNEILEIYLNIAEFGPDIYGVNAASYHFFGKPCSKINAAEGSFIALMLPSPNRYYHFVFKNQNLSRSKRRKIDRVLRDMYYSEYISEEQYRQYLRYRYFSKPYRIPAKSRRDRKR